MNAIETQSLALQSLVTDPPGTTYTYYTGGLIESATLPSPDASGNIYYHYLNEDWNGQGRGRFDKSKRQTALNGELAHTYIYYADATGYLQTKNAYSNTTWITLVTTYTYYNDTSNRMDSKTLVSSDSTGNFYYHYINEDWASQGYGRVDKSKRKTALSGELSHTYIYYADVTGRLQTKNAYSDSSWTTLVVTYSYYNDTANLMESKTRVSADSSGNIYYHYINENWNSQGFGRVDKSKRLTASSGELSHAYGYYTDSTGRLQTKLAYSDAGWATLFATRSYYNDLTNRLETKTLVNPDSSGNIYYH
ncbi:MAG: hypothetical protein Q8R48_08150, partial [Candidatus Omnitrophota bacterium]|nr:hypothetical protein [Candidatus Omnitrophota bacterium]